MNKNVIELYSQLIKADALAYNSPIDNQILESFRRQAISESDVDISDLGNLGFYDGIATAIYNIANKLRDNIDNLRELSSCSVRGISRSVKANIMLLGETSAGKTSFLNRIYGEDCGEIGPTPITAFPVSHRITETNSYLLVKFIHPQFTIEPEKKEGFVAFLNKYNLKKEFEINDNVFKPVGEDYKLEKKVEFVNFIREANSYPSCFEEIVWSHKRSDKKQIGATEFADFIDMPGTGGQEVHTENIESYFNKYGKTVDIILYLIKSDQGVSSRYEYLKTLKEEIKKAEVKADFIFVFQIDNKDPFEEKVNALQNFIFVEGVDANNGFSKSEIDFYSKAKILDSRGKKEDRPKANIALASIIKDFFINRCEEFRESLKVVNKPKEYDLLKAPERNERNINGLLFDFLESTVKKCHNGKLPKIEDLKKDFRDEFSLNTEIKAFNEDLENTLEAISSDIEENINNLFDFLATDDGWLFAKETEKEFDSTKYNKSFYNEYSTRRNWQRLIYYIQAYHWLRLTYVDNSYEKIYSQNIADPLKDVLYDNIKRLESIDTSFICKNFKDNEDF